MNERSTPQETLQDYFDELLNGEELLSKPRPSTAALRAAQYAEPLNEQQQKLSRLLQTAQPQLLVAEQVVAAVVTEEIQEWDPEPSAPPVTAEHSTVQQPIVELPQPEPADEAAVENALPDPELVSGYQMDGIEWLENGRPVWAQTRFDVLLFQVSGLTLAVPLVSLGQIQPLTDELTPLFGQADWFMGLQPTPAGKIRTVNTAKFVMPERYDAAFVETARYVVSINGVPWGLAVDSVNQPISLEPEDVKWRSERSKRPWLAGTVKAHMCALLDIPRIGQMLMDADRNTRRQPGYQ